MADAAMLQSEPGRVAQDDPAERMPARGDESVDHSCLAHLLGYQLAQADIPARRVFARHIGEPMGLRPVEFTLLVLVSANPGVTAKRLAQALAVTAPNITILLDRLSERGWVERVRSEADRRAQHIHLTPAGQKVARRALAVSKTMEQELVRHLTDGERAMLLELLQKVARQTR
jgi:DNA-binding MarR family transcriptional regulator